MNMIDNLTLSYFLNKTQYENIMNKKNNTQSNVAYTKDKHFYKKRILDLNKKLFRNEINDKQLNNQFNSFVKSCISYLKSIDTTEILQKQYEYMDQNKKTDNSSNILNTDDDTDDKVDKHILNFGCNAVNHDNSISITPDDTYDASGIKHLININMDLTDIIEDDIEPNNIIEETFVSNDGLMRNYSNMKKINLDTFVVKTSESIKPKILPKKQDVNIRTKEFKTKGIAKKKNITNIYEDNK